LNFVTWKMSSSFIPHSIVMRQTVPQLEDFNILFKVIREREENIIKLFKVVLTYKNSTIQSNKIRLHSLALSLNQAEEGQAKTEEIIINKYSDAILKEVRQQSVMKDFLSKLQEMYLKTKNRLIVLGVPQNIISYLDNSKQSERLTNGAMNAESIRLDAFLRSQIELSRRRFYDMQGLCLNQTEDVVNKLAQGDLNKSQESFMNLKIGQTISNNNNCETTPFSLLKTIVENGKDCSFSVKGTNKFPKTELSIYNVFELAADFKKPCKPGIKYEKSKTLNSEKMTAKPVQTPGRPVLKTTTLKLNIASDLSKKADDKANSFKKGSLRKGKLSSKKDHIEKNLNQTDYFSEAMEKYQECYFNQTIKSKVEEKNEFEIEENSQIKENFKREEKVNEAKPKMKNQTVNKIYLQLLAGNTEIKKSIDKYKASYDVFSQKQDENGNLILCKEEGNRVSTASSDKETNDGDSNKQRNSTRTFVRSCNDLDQEIFETSGQIELKKNYSKDDSSVCGLSHSSRIFGSQGKPIKAIHDRNILDVPKLNLSDNIFFEQKFDVNVEKKSLDRKIKKKASAPKSSKKQVIDKSFASTELDEFLFPNLNPRVGTPQSEDKRRSFESFYMLNSSKSPKFNGKNSEIFTPNRRTTVEKFMDLQQAKTEIFTSPKKSLMNMERFFSERTEKSSALRATIVK